MPEPLFEGLHSAGQFTDAYRTVAYQPRNQHDRQTRSETEDDRHQPVPGARQREGDIDHGQEIDQAVRTKSDSEEDTEDEGPQPTLFAIRVFEPFADPVIVLVMMVSAEEQHDAADDHESRQNRFTPMTQQMLDTVRLRPHEEGDTQQHVRG